MHKHELLPPLPKFLDGLKKSKPPAGETLGSTPTTDELINELLTYVILLRSVPQRAGQAVGRGHYNLATSRAVGGLHLAIDKHGGSKE
ncbi:hypothetical protein EVAR_6437_1 [Eumeta japonica]|uniref:Uncharacterized protein n=1 Tax=Eumeta variegata TaxID=151549 RepID=A0A4C1TFB4_EUMVA|nr:hypothetical protein EVAR_6437_1 [Eumeta japonica]